MERQLIKGGIKIDSEKDHEEVINEADFGVQRVLYYISNIWDTIKLHYIAQESEGLNLTLFETLPACQLVEYLKQVCTITSKVDLKASMTILNEILPLLEETNAMRILYALVTDKPLLHVNEYKVPDFRNLARLSAMQLRQCNVTLKLLISKISNMLKPLLEDTEMKELFMNEGLIAINRLCFSRDFLNMAATLASNSASDITDKCTIGLELISKL